MLCFLFRAGVGVEIRRALFRVTSSLSSDWGEDRLSLFGGMVQKLEARLSLILLVQLLRIRRCTSFFLDNFAFGSTSNLESYFTFGR